MNVEKNELMIVEEEKSKRKIVIPEVKKIDIENSENN